MTLPDTLDVDDDGYPDEARLAEISAADAVEDGARWMVETFPKLAASLGYGHVDVTDVFGEPEKRIEFSTGGWSGCEDFIAAVLQNTMLNAMYYHSWQRGGHHEFRVPLSALKETTDPAIPAGN